MIYEFFSPKGGQGCTTVAVAVAMHLGNDAPIIDLGGDAPAVIGTYQADDQPGMADLSRPQPHPYSNDEIRRCVAHNSPVPYMSKGDDGEITEQAVTTVTNVLHDDVGDVVIDTGTSGLFYRGDGPVKRYMVIRPCYVALKRAVRIKDDLPHFDGVILITEPGRSLNESDVTGVVGVPVVATIPQDPAIARAVDAGLLASRIPASLKSALQEVWPQ